MFGNATKNNVVQSLKQQQNICIWILLVVTPMQRWRHRRNHSATPRRLTSSRYRLLLRKHKSWYNCTRCGWWAILQEAHIYEHHFLAMRTIHKDQMQMHVPSGWKQSLSKSSSTQSWTVWWKGIGYYAAAVQGQGMRNSQTRRKTPASYFRMHWEHEHQN